MEADARSDLAAWRAEVPALALRVHGQRLAYLDNAATTLMAQPVIDAVARVATHLPGNVHRGVHALAEAADAAFEGARATIARHLGGRPGEVVLTSGTTAAINLVAQAWGRTNLAPGDAVVVSALEHHANLVPWQAVCAERGATLRIAPIDDAGRIDLAALDALLDARVKLVAVAHLSNVVGTIAPIAAIAARAHAVGARLLVDGAQALPHGAIDVGALGCDFYACSGHKAFGPTGTGALGGRAELLAAMPPWQHGGEMVAAVEATRARLVVKPRGDGFSLQNALGHRIAVVWVRVGEDLFVAKDVRDGGEVTLQPEDRVDETRLDVAGSRRFVESQWRPLVMAPLGDGEFLASVEGKGFVSTGGVTMSLHDGRHVVRGEVER